jgi:Ser/Thr protein kinase RdoA (MazF antagonist)
LHCARIGRCWSIGYSYVGGYFRRSYGVGQTEWVDEPTEEILVGGNVAGRVIRIGATVRKPVGPDTHAVEALLAYLAEADFSAAPRSLGRDEMGRQVLEYIPGEIAHGKAALTLNELKQLGGLIRQFHDAVEGFVPPVDAQWDVAIPPDHARLVCHNDLAPWNLVRDKDRWVFIDWDGAGPASRLWDVE